jgi:uncharacterized FAD-dependent dehydrogenase
LVQIILHDIAKNWYSYLVDKGVQFEWETKVIDINFNKNILGYSTFPLKLGKVKSLIYDELIFAVGKSGIDFGKELAEEYVLPTEAKSVQIGVRFRSTTKIFSKIN